MTLLPHHHDWIQQSIQLTSDLLAMDSQVLARLYTPAHLAYLKRLHDLKQAAYRALQGNLTMAPDVSAVAGYLRLYADLHNDFWKSDDAAFREGMALARAGLQRALNEQGRQAA